MSDTVSFKKGLSENITTAEISPGQILVATDNGQVRVDYSNKTDNTSSSVFVSDPSKVASMSFNTSTRKLTYVKGDGTSTDVSIPTGDTDVKVTNTLSTTTKAYITGTSNASTNTGTQYFDSGVYLENTAGNLHADGTINGLVPYASCSTAADTAAKTVSVNGTFTLATGARVIIKFTATNSAANPTLNVNSTGAKAIYYKGIAITAGYLMANKTYQFIYNGTQYDLVGDVDTNTTYTSLKNPYSLILKANGSTLTNGSYDGSAEKTVDLSPAKLGAATSGHTHALDGDKITGTLPISKGGTGATTAAGALNSLGAAEAGHTHTTVNGHTVESDVPANAIFTDGKVTNTLGTTTKAYITGTTSATTSTSGQIFDTGIYIENTAGNLHADGTINGAIPYGSCSTAAETAAKTVTVNGTFSLVTGARVVVKFTVTNTVDNPTLNVNSTGAKAIYYRNAAISKGYLAANRTYQFIYNGTQYELIGDLDTNSTYSNASLGQGYGTCTTAADTAAKVVTLSNYVLTVGGVVAVKFTNAVPANATMNINSKGAKAIYYRGSAIVANIIKAGDTATFIYDGTQYHLIGRGSVGYTPAGAVSQPTFSGSSLTSTGTFTPAGTVSVSTNGTANKTALVTTTTGDATYTPAGSVTVTPSVTAPTATVNSITAVGTLPSCTMPTFSATVSDELLTFNWTAGSFSAGTLPTKGSDTTVVKSVSVNATGSFSGTGVRLITGNITVPSTYTASFSGTAGSVSVSGTPSGIISQPTFNGTGSTIQLA